MSISYRLFRRRQPADLGPRIHKPTLVEPGIEGREGPLDLHALQDGGFNVLTVSIKNSKR
jgi:hypothetical protein